MIMISMVWFVFFLLNLQLEIQNTFATLSFANCFLCSFKVDISKKLFIPADHHSELYISKRFTKLPRQGILPNNYLFKVNYRITRTRNEICSKLTIKTPEQRQWRHSVAFIVNFWTDFTPFSSVSFSFHFGMYLF